MDSLDQRTMYNENSFKEPFWAENNGFMTGRDPLGIQNSSIATYSRLLPGMTNVTLRLRYYGFYMWLLSEYDALRKDDNAQTLSYHYNFIRRAELAIAYFMVNKYPDEKSIVGSEFANANIATIEALGYYDLEKGADKHKNTQKGTVYWDYTSGALGQYFAGSLINLQLMEMSNRFFIILDKGRALAETFKESVNAHNRKSLLQVIESGKLYPTQIDALKEFSINGIDHGTSEWKFYKGLMLADDAMTDSTGKSQKQRKQTIKHYLEYINNKALYQNLSFDAVQYLLKPKKTTQDAPFGWYYYRINELFHYYLETIFWGLLVELDGWVVDVREFIETVSNKTFQLSLEGFMPAENTTVSEVLETGFQGSLEDDQERLELLVGDSKLNMEAMALAFKMILRLYLENKINLDSLCEYEKENYLTDKKGRISDVVSQYVQRHIELPYSKFLYTSIKNLINDHVATAYRKMGNGESNLLKFVIEDNFITHVQTMKPKFTSPRLRTLDNFLRDLRFIEEENLSEHGEELLLELSEQHD